MHTSLVKLLCHQAPLTAVAIETGGWYMATAGMDAKLKIWDIRNYKSVNPTTTTVSCSACTSVFRSSLTEQLQTLSHFIGILILYNVHLLYNCIPSHPCTPTHTHTHTHTHTQGAALLSDISSCSVSVCEPARTASYGTWAGSGGVERCTRGRG